MLHSKSFASWTGTFDSLSCMVCPAVSSQWSLAIFIWEAFLWGWEPGGERFWIWMHLNWSVNVRYCCCFACQAVRGWDCHFEMLCFSSHRGRISIPVCCHTPLQTHLWLSWGSRGIAAADPVLPAMCIWSFRNYFSPLHMYPVCLGLAEARGPSLTAVL